MKTTKLIIGLLLSSGSILAQTPKLYIHIVSHNEPSDNIQSSALVFNKFKNNALQMANIIDSKNAKWNLQTSDGFVLGALQYQSAGTSATDIFERYQILPTMIILKLILDRRIKMEEISQINGIC
jgi:hypothetical protein